MSPPVLARTKVFQRDVLLLGNEKAFYADSAYCYQQTSDKLKRFGIANKVQSKGYRHQPLSQADKQQNAEIALGVERTFAMYKVHYKLSKTRFMGLTKNTTFYGIVAIAHNIQKGASFLSKYGIPTPKTTG